MLKIGKYLAIFGAVIGALTFGAYVILGMFYQMVEIVEYEMCEQARRYERHSS